MNDAQLDEALSSWHTINKALRTFTEADCKNALNRELVGNRRKDIAIRLHTRYCTLRQVRERNELIESLSDVPAFLVGAV